MNKTRENLTWGSSSNSPEGLTQIPLRRIIEDRKVEDTFRLDNVGGSVDLELTWMPVLN